MFVALVAAPVLAEQCVPERQEGLFAATPAGVFYVEPGDCDEPCTFSLDVFQESNGILGLQKTSAAACGAPADPLLTLPLAKPCE